MHPRLSQTQPHTLGAVSQSRRPRRVIDGKQVGAGRFSYDATLPTNGHRVRQGWLRAHADPSADD
jgi:hypothetical protein